MSLKCILTFSGDQLYQSLPILSILYRLPDFLPVFHLNFNDFIFQGFFLSISSFTISTFNRDEMEEYLCSCNAFYEDTEGKILQIMPKKHLPGLRI